VRKIGNIVIAEYINTLLSIMGRTVRQNINTKQRRLEAQWSSTCLHVQGPGFDTQGNDGIKQHYRKNGLNRENSTQKRRI
jgi:hypothetical protein